MNFNSQGAITSSYWCVHCTSSAEIGEEDVPAIADDGFGVVKITSRAKLFMVFDGVKSLLMVFKILLSRLRHTKLFGCGIRGNPTSN